jgi:hypothetical protein
MSQATLPDPLCYPPDEVGECDRCHNHGELWLDTETDGAGDFAYCGECWVWFLRQPRPIQLDTGEVYWCDNTFRLAGRSPND